MKKQDKTKDISYSILYKRMLTDNGYYVFFPCQCVEGYYDKTDGSFLDNHGHLYYSCNNYTMINTGQSDTYYYEATLDDIKNMFQTEDKDEAVTKFYDKLKSNLLIGYINTVKEKIEIYEVNKDKLELLKNNNIMIDVSNSSTNVVLTREQIEFLISEDDDKTIKEKLKMLLKIRDSLHNRKILNKNEKLEKLRLAIPFANLKLARDIKPPKPKQQVKELSKKEDEEEAEISGNLTLDTYNYVTERLIGQDESTRKVISSMVSNLKAETPEELIKPFIIGGTGSGKSFLFKLIEKCMEKPVIIVDCNHIVQSGYEGKMIEDILKDLYLLCDRDLEETEHAIVVFDEIDKIGDKGATVSEIGAQEALLKFIEGQKYVVNMDKTEMDKVIIDTSMMSIVGCGAFEVLKEKDKIVGFTKVNESKLDTAVLVKKGGMITELLGRFNLYVEYNEVTKDMIKEQLEKSLTSPIKIKERFFKKNYGVNLKFNESFIERLCDDAIKRNAGFRGVDQVVNQALSEVNFVIQTTEDNCEEVVISEETIDNPKKYCLKIAKNKKN